MASKTQTQVKVTSTPEQMAEAGKKAMAEFDAKKIINGSAVDVLNWIKEHRMTAGYKNLLSQKRGGALARLNDED